MPLAVVSLLAAAVVLVPAVWLLRAHNALVRDRHRVENARQQIDVQLARRHDLVPNLVAAVRGALAHERDTLEALVAARGRALATARAHAGVGESSAAEQGLAAALGRVVTVVEAHPELRALREVGTLQEELRSTENRIAFARQHYNDAAARFNTRLELLPGSLLARGDERAPLWQASAGVEQAPRVELARVPVA
jgi:LemA protein